VKITTDQLLQAARNTFKPHKNRSELLYNALQHVRMSAASKTKPATACDEACGLVNNTTESKPNYGTNQTEGQR